MDERARRAIPSSACVSHAGKRVLAIAKLPQSLFNVVVREIKKACFGATPETNTRDACATRNGELPGLLVFTILNHAHR
jgi:hypothetical protein